MGSKLGKKTSSSLQMVSEALCTREQLADQFACRATQVKFGVESQKKQTLSYQFCGTMKLQAVCVTHW